MHELFSELIKILESQRDAQAALVGLSEKKTMAISSGDSLGLQAIVDEERAVLSRIRSVEKRQGQCIAAIAAGLNVPTYDVRMSLVIEKAEGEQKERLEGLRSELSGLIEKQTALNGLNMKLLQMNMDYVQFLINASSNQQTGSTYGSLGDERKAMGTTGKKLLDRKV